MTEVSTIKFFEFLNKSDNWFEKADTNNDDVVIKSEFRDFLSAESSSFKDITGVLPGEDIINRFWNQLDISKEYTRIKGHKQKDINAVAKNTDEFKTLSCNLESMNALEKFFQNTVLRDVPTFLASDRRTAWRDLVRSQLETFVEEFMMDPDNKNSSVTESMLSERYMEIRNSITADECDDYYYNQLKQAVLKEYEKYEISEDPYVIKLVDSYIQNVDRTITAEKVLEGMKALIDAYLATAGIEEKKANLNLLKIHGYNPTDNSELNELQTQVLRKDLKVKILGDLQNDTVFKLVPNALTKALEEFVEAKICETNFGGFKATLNNTTVELFKQTTPYQNIVQILNCVDTTEGSAFYKALSDALAYTDDPNGKVKMSKAIDKLLEPMPEFSSALEEVCKNLENYCTGTTVDTGKIINEVVNKISDIILKRAEVVFNSSDKVSVIKDVFFDVKEDATHIKNNNMRLEKNKEIALKLANTLCEKSDLLKKEVFKWFTSNYDSKFSSMNAEEIEKALVTLGSILINFAGVENCTIASWGSIPSSITVGTNLSKSSILDATVKDGENAVATGRITYQLNDSKVTTLNIKGSKTASERVDVLTVLVDNTPVATKEIKVVTVSYSNETIINNVANWGTSIDSASAKLYNLNGNVNSHITNCDFKNLYSTDAIIRLDFSEMDGDRWCTSRINRLNTALTNLTGNIVSALVTAGFDKSILDIVSKEVVNKYLNARFDADRDSGGAGSESRLRGVAQRWFKNNPNDKNNRHHISVFWDKNGDDACLYVVRFKDVVDDIIAAYQNLAGSL